MADRQPARKSWIGVERQRLERREAGVVRANRLVDVTLSSQRVAAIEPARGQAERIDRI